MLQDVLYPFLMGLNVLTSSYVYCTVGTLLLDAGLAAPPTLLLIAVSMPRQAMRKKLICTGHPRFQFPRIIVLHETCLVCDVLIYQSFVYSIYGTLRIRQHKRVVSKSEVPFI